MSETPRNPWLDQQDALEDLQHALIVDDAQLRRDAEERLERARTAIGKSSKHVHTPSQPRKWTNPSVKPLLAEGDPIDVIRTRARDLTLRALGSGWAPDGPPYDPAALAHILQIDITPRQLDADEDARLAVHGDRVVIEFNPTRPAPRRRFSIAHEIGHTLFADHAEAVRHRSLHKSEGDAWQLEMLCNIAAAEILMPAGSFIGLEEETPTIEHLLELRGVYGVSTEAIFNRVAHLAPSPTASFVASPFGGDEFRIDYVMTSRTWPSPSSELRNAVIPAASVLSRSRAIGETAKSVDEAWMPTALVQCVGLPPYRGYAAQRRVAGLVSLLGADVEPGPRVWEILGDATDPPPSRRPAGIAFVVNDRARQWRGAFANAIRRRWPNAQPNYTEWFERNRPRLGEVWRMPVGDGIVLFAIVAQHGYGPSRQTRLRYDALRRSLARVAADCRRDELTLHVPRIGSGEAGGNWDIVHELLVDEVASQGLEVTVYIPPGQKNPETAAQPSLFAALP